MNRSLNIHKTLIIFAIPLLLVASMIYFTSTSFFKANTDKLSLAITIDLLLTVPLIYFLLIRKTTIPKTTIVPFVILSIVVCSFILPSENQHYLSLFKTWVLPLIEISVLSYVIYKIVKTIRLYKQHKKETASDFFTILKSTCQDILPKGIVIPFATEIAVIYYGFICWKKTKLKSNHFTYHKDSGTIALLSVLILIIGIETFTLHYLLAKWSEIAAWILTGISIYSAIQILGFLKSMFYRPIVVDSERIKLYYGIMNETSIYIKDIESIELSTKDIDSEKTARKLSLLGNLESHNTIIKLKQKNTLFGLYGIKRPYTTLALHLDKNQDFKTLVENKLKNLPIS
jgi:hypothetical protein